MELDLPLKRIHFIGIGGIGMSAIAEILQDLGYTVQGSDGWTVRMCNGLKNVELRFLSAIMCAI